MEILIGFIVTAVFTLVLGTLVAVLTDRHNKPRYVIQCVSTSLIIYSVLTMIQIGLGII